MKCVGERSGSAVGGGPGGAFMDVFCGALPSSFRPPQGRGGRLPLSASHQSNLSVGGNPYGSRTYDCSLGVLDRCVDQNHGIFGPGFVDLGGDGTVRGSRASTSR